MTWLQRYRIAHYLGNSVWVFPAMAIGAAMLLVRFVHQLEEGEGWQSNLDPDSMRAALGNLAGATLTFVVFVCSSLLLVVQLASAQLTPRIIGVLFRDPVMKLTLSMFVFTFTFSIAALVRIGSSVPKLTAEIAAYSSVICIGLFLYLIDRVGKMLRPSGALQSVATQAHQVIENVYPRRLRDAGTRSSQFIDLSGKKPTSTVVSKNEGVVLAFDLQGIVDLASRHDCIIELVPQVGNLVAPGNPLFRIYDSAVIPARSLLHSIALGAERTMEQDPAFAFRVMVDIASKGLSPAINDPTTAVLALDRIHHLLRHVGNRCLENERVRDAAGRVRLIFRTPDWEDFVALAVTEIRQFGATSIQIARRLRAMLEDLIRDLPEERAVLLRKELEVLRRSVERFFPEPEDRALAGISDSQGVGGKRESNPTGQSGSHVH